MPDNEPEFGREELRNLLLERMRSSGGDGRRRRLMEALTEAAFRAPESRSDLDIEDDEYRADVDVLDDLIDAIRSLEERVNAIEHQIHQRRRRRIARRGAIEDVPKPSAPDGR